MIDGINFIFITCFIGARRDESIVVDFLMANCGAYMKREEKRKRNMIF